MGPIYPTISSVILSALPKNRHSAMTGLIVIFSALGGTTGSRMVGEVTQRYSGQTAFYLLLIPMAALLASLFFFRRWADRAQAHYEEPQLDESGITTAG